MEALGAGVTNLKLGDRVAPEPGVPCRKCAYGKSGRCNLCPEMHFMATSPVDGALSERVVWPADFAFKIPDNMSLDEAALIAVDLEDFRLDLARELGATHTISGLPLSPGGMDVFGTVGLPPEPEVALDIVSAASRETDIQGIFRCANCSPAATELVSSGWINLSALVTPHYDFAQTPEAFIVTDTERSSSMKVMIDL